LSDADEVDVDDDDDAESSLPTLAATKQPNRLNSINSNAREAVK
jgi:hypothetical protein